MSQCDGKRPSCGQCLKLGLKCDGYESRTGTVFVNVTTGHFTPRLPEGEGERDGAGDGRGEEGSRGEPSSSSSSSRQVTLPDLLALSAYEQKYLAVFWDMYLPGQRQFPHHITRYTGGGWTNALPRLFGLSPPVRKALLAMCLTAAGQTEGRTWEKQEGLRSYMSSLKDMSTALACPGRADSNVITLCVASRLSSLYEALFGRDEHDKINNQQSRNWRNHIQGELAVLTRQPPEYYVSGYLHQLFVDGRFHLTAGAIHMRKKTVLSNAEWKTVPWTAVPKTPKDLLIDIFVDMPTILQDLDALQACPDPASQSLMQDQLVQKCLACERELVAWRASVGVVEANYAFYNVDTGTDTDNLNPHASFSFSIDRIAAAHIMCLYWSICIIVYSTLRTLSLSFSLSSHSHPQAHPPLPLPLTQTIDPAVYCRRIAEAVPLLLHPRSGVYGFHLTTFPVAMALTYLSRDGHEYEEKTMILDAFATSHHGSAVGGFIASLHRQQQQRQQPQHTIPSVPAQLAGEPSLSG
ncbi:hypothetical protein A1O3_02201 [Capronia epimyces CBS 606.96]|uniref:Zn(2)-C6 fungal-type domain-containing protein n=1 Tax=Capronia epimyces CBS 606.96 TaxID=1182542 RepID=W9Y8F9_9EURO|nr:uncharacterized protein A1O3_02201 [Capronia epimyces CBS 606.96]EXJ89137.1 hypothetical protein A1O3_02201 [Capronia epimyces CBS 606.96]